MILPAMFTGQVHLSSNSAAAKLFFFHLLVYIKMFVLNSILRKPRRRLFPKMRKTGIIFQNSRVQSVGRNYG